MCQKDKTESKNLTMPLKTNLFERKFSPFLSLIKFDLDYVSEVGGRGGGG